MYQFKACLRLPKAIMIESALYWAPRRVLTQYSQKHHPNSEPIERLKKKRNQVSFRFVIIEVMVIICCLMIQTRFLATKPWKLRLFFSLCIFDSFSRTRELDSSFSLRILHDLTRKLHIRKTRRTFIPKFVRDYYNFLYILRDVTFRQEHGFDVSLERLKFWTMIKGEGKQKGHE